MNVNIDIGWQMQLILYFTLNYTLWMYKLIKIHYIVTDLNLNVMCVSYR